LVRVNEWRDRDEPSGIIGGDRPRDDVVHAPYPVGHVASSHDTTDRGEGPLRVLVVEHQSGPRSVAGPPDGDANTVGALGVRVVDAPAFVAPIGASTQVGNLHAPIARVGDETAGEPGGRGR